MPEIAVQGAVADLQSAVKAIFDERPEIVVTGVDLNGGSGIELIESARQSPRPPKIVVVAATPTRDEWCRHLAAGADRFVALDGELTELRDVVGTLARGKQHSLEELALLGRITAGVTHDLNNYLTALSGDLSLLSRNPDDHDLITQAIESTDAMARLTHTLLQYVRGDSPPFQLVDPALLVRRVMRILGRSVPSNITVELDVAEKVKRVHGAQPELEQMFANLVLNSIDAMPDGGGLRVRVGPGAGTESPPLHRGPTSSEAVFIEVADNGNGAPGATTKPGRRMGLGLGIVRRVVERHAGTLRISPRQPNGTVVTIFLPTRPAS